MFHGIMAEGRADLKGAGNMSLKVAYIEWYQSLTKQTKKTIDRYIIEIEKMTDSELEALIILTAFENQRRKENRSRKIIKFPSGGNFKG